MILSELEEELRAKEDEFQRRREEEKRGEEDDTHVSTYSTTATESDVYVQNTIESKFDHEEAGTSSQNESEDVNDDEEMEGEAQDLLAALDGKL
jgi:hypothetical protein